MSGQDYNLLQTMFTVAEAPYPVFLGASLSRTLLVLSIGESVRMSDGLARSCRILYWESTIPASHDQDKAFDMAAFTGIHLGLPRNGNGRCQKK
jgi:hypothetical protein